jgi:hypothetical protein
MCLKPLSSHASLPHTLLASLLSLSLIAVQRCGCGLWQLMLMLMLMFVCITCTVMQTNINLALLAVFTAKSSVEAMKSCDMVCAQPQGI